MIKLIPLGVIITSCQFFSYAQSSSTLMGARELGMGYTSSCLSDGWSVFNNIGGLSKVTETTVAFAYDACAGFKPFNKAAAIVVIPLPIGVAGLGLYRFGDDLYSEQVVTAGYSNAFGLASLGIKINYVQYRVKGVGSKGVFSASFGGVAQLTPKLLFGAHIVNLNQPVVNPDTRERLPTVLSAGLAFKPSDVLIISTEVEKDLDFKPIWKTGIEYKVHRKFFFRTGINLHPNAGCFGFGFKGLKLYVDYAYQFRPGSFSRHQSSIAYIFKKAVK